MGEQILQLGNKIEMTQIKSRVLKASVDKKVYASQILDMQGDNLITAAMPIYEEHLIPLETGTKYDTFFYTKNGIMRSECEILKRGKEGRIYVMEMALTKELKKFQRREYFRCACSIDTQVAELSPIEALAVSKNHELPKDYNERVNNAMMVDISGGGVRVISRTKYEKSQYVGLKFPLIVGGKTVEFNLLGRVVLSMQSENNILYYDNRIQFKEITQEERDEIVKYVFEQQRRMHKRERGGF